MENIYRNVYSGDVDITYVGKEVRVAGWINSIRKLGGLTFVTLRDETGIVQIITEDADMFKGITRESTVTITGTVKLRTEDMINPNMKTGKITNSVISRSVLKNIKPAKNSLAVKPSIGADASVLENGIVIASDSGFEPVYTASNNIYARGGRPQYIQCCVNLAQDMREIRLKEIMQKISADCAQLGLVISGGHTQVEAGNTRAIVAVTAVGFTENVKEPLAVGSNMAKPGDDIIMTKCIGIGEVQNYNNNNKQKRYFR